MIDTSKIITGLINSKGYTVTAPIIKEDYGLYLQIEGIELPSTYEVDFSNSENSGTSVTMIGNSDGVLIPSQFISTGKDVFAFLYHVGSDFGRTVYKFRIPNKVRPDRTDETPTPEEQSVIDQAISALNEAVEQTSADVASADQSAQSAQGYAEQAETAKTNAQTYANNAQTSATSANQSATASANSATASAQSASQSAQIKADVEDLVDDAQGYAQASERSATASANSASQAQGYAQSASASAQSASGYASSAQTFANTASAKAQDASGYAQTASTKASESAQSATNAQGYAQTAEQAKTASQTAQGLAESARDSAISAKTDAESAKDDAESARDEAQQAVASISGALADKAPVITDTASGAIASFSDGADDLPLKSLVVDINPVQDLHGQENPYPAGGGKNLFNNTATSQTTNGITFTVNSDGTVNANGTATAYAKLTVGTVTLAEGTYIVNGGINDNAYVNIASKVNAYGSDAQFEVASGGETLTVNVSIARSGVTVSNVVFKPMIRLASETDATFAPYENICPISGWTQINAYNDPMHGGNIEWNQYIENANFANGIDKWSINSAQTSSDYISVNNNVATINMLRTQNVTQITNKCGSIKTVIGHKYYYRIFIKSSAWASSGNKVIAHIGGYWAKAITTLPVNEWVEIAFIYNGISISQNLDAGIRKYADENYSPFDVKEFVLCDLTQMFGAGNEPSTVEEFRALFPYDYYPYNAGEKTTVSAVNEKPYTHVTINLGQTVYGGKLDVLSGELVVDRVFATKKWGQMPSVYDGNTHSTKSLNFDANVLKGGQNSITNITATYNEATTAQSTHYYIGSNFKTVYVTLPNDTNTDTDIQVCGTLATPIEIQLSANQINSLYGVNNIWADSGDTEAVYRADTKLFIERLTAPDSADMIADANITSGQYFMVGNSLYKATANIANGGQIIVGTNCIRKSLSEALNEINA